MKFKRHYFRPWVSPYRPRPRSFWWLLGLLMVVLALILYLNRLAHYLP